MSERRKLPRNRVYYGGRVAFNARSSTLACVVRNFSQFGARIEFENAALVPEEVDFEIERKGISCLARLVWRDQFRRGPGVFRRKRDAEASFELNWARKLRASERANRQLQSRLDQLRSEH